MITDQDLIEYAQEEATEVAICLWKFRQKHDSCSGCSTRGFCDLLLKKLQGWEEEEGE